MFRKGVEGRFIIQSFKDRHKWKTLGIPSQLSLENISEEFKYTKDCMKLFRQGHTRASVKWEEMNNGKAEQEENISEVLTNLEGESIVAFTDRSALGNPGPTGAGAAIYMNGLNSHAERLKKEICKNGNNYLGEIIGLEITLKYLAEEAEVSNRSIHIFTDCQSAIESVFGNGMPSYKVDTVLHIRRISSYLKDRGNSVVVHWIPGHKGFSLLSILHCLII